MTDSRGNWGGEHRETQRDLAALSLLLHRGDNGDADLLLAQIQQEGRTDEVLRQAVTELVRVKKMICDSAQQPVEALLARDVADGAGEQQ